MSTRLFDLSGKVALVTGGNAGLGRAMALGLRDAGARVAIAARRPERNADVAAELGEAGTAFVTDVADETSVERTVAAVVERFGRLDILINNAGIANRASVMQLERDEWDRILGVNLTGAFLCTKHAARVMQAQRSGKIINIASVYGEVAPSKGLLVAYTVSKHGLIGLTRANASELGAFGIQVNAILPGWMLTELNDDTPEWFLERVGHVSPAGRVGVPADIVGSCLFLASPASDWVTGTCLTLDGGFLATDRMDRSPPDPRGS
jgi:2-deoxy-D-gluconate 3-dehydrogenase